MSLTVKLEIYEGPLDLLLHLIRKNEVDIYDIPIALITGQYLAYLELMESMNVEVAGEFLLMAATLTQIKSKMLLPTPALEDETEEEDPRMAIVRPLLEYMRLKDAAEALERRAMLNRDVFARRIYPEDMESDSAGEILIKANLFDLVDAFRSIAERFKTESGLEIRVETKTIQERLAEIIRFMERKQQASFFQICETDRNRAELVLSFLAILELTRIGCLRLYQNPATSTLTLFFISTEPLLALPDPETPWPEPGLASINKEDPAR